MCVIGCIYKHQKLGTQICKRKQSTKNNLGHIRTIFSFSFDAQRSNITMDFLKKTKEILKQSGKQLRNESLSNREMTCL